MKFYKKNINFFIVLNIEGFIVLNIIMKIKNIHIKFCNINNFLIKNDILKNISILYICDLFPFFKNFKKA